MPIEWELENNDLAVIKVSGQLGKDEFEKIQSILEPIIQKHGKVKVLVLLKEFLGWESSQGWEDTSFADRNDTYIKKFAFVGEDKWRDQISLFTFKDFRSVPIEYFESNDEDKARLWLNSNE